MKLNNAPGIQGSEPACADREPTTILAIESSCDETACAIVQKTGGRIVVLAQTTATSLSKHKETKGIVPEVAAREQLKCILPVIQDTLERYSGTTGQRDDAKINKENDSKFQNPSSLFDSIDAIAVTTSPGLIGSLLVGVETARTLAFTWDKPLIPVNHVKAHPYANFVQMTTETEKNTTTQHNLEFLQNRDNVTALHRDKHIQNHTNHQSSIIHHPQLPALSWVISGGHTSLYLMNSHQDIQLLGQTVDDSAGECFDKCARLLGFNYPGGPEIDALSRKTSDLNHPQLPRPMTNIDTYDMSFSGLKTAFLHAFESGDYSNQALAFALQEAVSDVILKKTHKALKEFPEVKSVIVSGGVAANSRIRSKLESLIATQPQGNNIPTQQHNNETNNQSRITTSALRQTAKQASSVVSSPSSIIHHQSSISIHFPPLSLCTDNAVMIGTYALFHMNEQTSWQSVSAQPTK